MWLLTSYFILYTLDKGRGTQKYNTQMKSWTSPTMSLFKRLNSHTTFFVFSTWWFFVANLFDHTVLKLTFSSFNLLTAVLHLPHNIRYIGRIIFNSTTAGSKPQSCHSSLILVGHRPPSPPSSHPHPQPTMASSWLAPLLPFSLSVTHTPPFFHIPPTLKPHPQALPQSTLIPLYT